MATGKTRNCPKCNKLLVYKWVSSFYRAKTNDSVCSDCNLHKPLNLTRECPVCLSQIKYASRAAFHRANKLHTKCNTCKQKLTFSKEIEEQIISLYSNGHSITKISRVFNVQKNRIKTLLINLLLFNPNRPDKGAALIKHYRGINYDEYLKTEPKYKLYKANVLRITRKQDINTLTNYNKRGNSGEEGAYHLDHKYSIIEGFRNDIPYYIIGSIYNLEFIPWMDNITKRTNCSISKEQLLKKHKWQQEILEM